MIMKRLKPKISLPKMFRIVEKSLLSGEIIIAFEVNPFRKSFLTRQLYSLKILKKDNTLDQQ